MSFFGDLEFFVYLTFVMIPAIVLGYFEKPLKYYRLFVSVLTILLILGTDKISLLFFVVF